mmetsp:Transcript_20950/g.67788  ORF Transcript_20950/g.67788 Transcript_20950/m.67788 type:complete len:265 (-) Transcript_20950:2103-2897(-)
MRRAHRTHAERRRRLAFVHDFCYVLGPILAVEHPNRLSHHAITNWKDVGVRVESWTIGFYAAEVDENHPGRHLKRHDWLAVLVARNLEEFIARVRPLGGSRGERWWRHRRRARGPRGPSLGACSCTLCPFRDSLGRHRKSLHLERRERCEMSRLRRGRALASCDGEQFAPRCDAHVLHIGWFVWRPSRPTPFELELDPLRLPSLLALLLGCARTHSTKVLANGFYCVDAPNDAPPEKPPLLRPTSARLFCRVSSLLARNQHLQR